MREKTINTQIETTSLIGKKVMLISHGMPPALTGSSVVVRNLATEIPAEEILVAGEQWRMSQATGQYPKCHRFHYVWKQPRIDSIRLTKWLRRLSAPIVLYRLVRLAKKNHCNAIVGVYPSEYYLAMGLVVSKLTRKPFFSYFHNTYFENRKGLSSWFAKFLQKRVFKASRVVFTMSDGMTDFLQAKHPNIKFKSLVHCHKIPHHHDAMLPPKPGTPTKVVFLGNANESNWNAFEQFWQATKGKDVVLTIISSIPPKVFSKHGIGGDKVRFLKVPFQEELAELMKHDIMLLPHGYIGGLSDAEYKTIFPTKTISYLLTRRPILALSPSHSFLTRWLRENCCALVVDRPDVDEIQNAFATLQTNKELRTKLVCSGDRAVLQFKSETVASTFAKTISEAIP